MRWHDAELIALIVAVGLADLVVMGLLLRLVWRCHAGRRSGADRAPSSALRALPFEHSSHGLRGGHRSTGAMPDRREVPQGEKGRRALRGSMDPKCGECWELDQRAMRAVEGWR